MKNNRILKYLSTLAMFLLVFGLHAQSWQEHFDEGKRLYKAKDYEGAYRAFQKAQAGAPNPAQIGPFLAQSAYRANMFKEAAEAYNRSIVDDSDTWSHYNEGNAHYKSDDYAKAIESYKEALRKDPTNEMARYNLTQAMKKMKQQQEQQNQQQNQNNNQNQQAQNSNQNNDPSNPNEQKPEKNQDSPDNQNRESQTQNQPKLGKEQTDQLLESMNQADNRAKDKLKEKEKVEGQGKRKKDW
jgi:tetratricopeptide (TPR) repeat protein